MFSSFEPSEVPDLVHNSDNTSTSASVESSSDDDHTNNGMDFHDLLEE